MSNSIEKIAEIKAEQNMFKSSLQECRLLHSQKFEDIKERMELSRQSLLEKMQTIESAQKEYQEALNEMRMIVSPLANEVKELIILRNKANELLWKIATRFAMVITSLIVILVVSMNDKMSTLFTFISKLFS